MEPFARTIEMAKKYVVSSTLAGVDWNAELVQVSDWGSGAAANFDWMREAKRENTRGGL